MYPPAFAIVAADSSVTALLGTDPVRFWPFGEGEPDPELPYAVWQTVFGSPLNHINELPNTDSYGVQIDVYAKEASDARAVAAALRSAIEPHAHITAYNGESRDPVTRNYRYSFNSDWFVNR